MAVAEITNIVIEKGTDFEATFNLFDPDQSATILSGLSTTYATIRKYPDATDGEEFGKTIKANTGTITLRTDSATGTIIESFDVGRSSSISINGGELTINPTDSLSGLTTYFVVFPAAAYKDTFESSSSVGITTYSFTTTQPNFQLFAWASNNAGQLGQNSGTYYSSPIQIPGTQWSKIVAGDNQPSFGIKTDGTLWSWGYNQYGNLGQNNITNYSSPIQIPGTQWSSISSGNNHSMAIKQT